jgi:hypothetical protein
MLSLINVLTQKNTENPPHPAQTRLKNRLTRTPDILRTTIQRRLKLRFNPLTPGHPAPSNP